MSATLDVEDVALPAYIVPTEIQDNLVDALCAVHNGVYRMIPYNKEVVETSSNLAIVEIGEGHTKFLILIRSSRDSMPSARSRRSISPPARIRRPTTRNSPTR